SCTKAATPSAAAPMANCASTTHGGGNSTTAARWWPTTAPTHYGNGTRRSASTSAPTPSSATTAATDSTWPTPCRCSPDKTSPRGRTPHNPRVDINGCRREVTPTDRGGPRGLRGSAARVGLSYVAPRGGT